MFLEIDTPEKRVYEGEVSIATFPGTEGSFQVMTDHAPLVSTLVEGEVSFKTSKGLDKVTITSGVVEVLNNKIVLLADGLVD